MNYYDELILRIQGLTEENENEEAQRLILNELDLPYVPKDAEEKLKEFLKQIRENREVRSEPSLQQIEEYLYKDDRHQLIAVSYLGDRNLRSCIDLCRDYLLSDGNVNAKAYLITSLILQEVDAEMVLRRNGTDWPFNPAKLILPENSAGYRTGLSILREQFLKDPSKLNLAEELLYKEAILSLPLILSEEEGKHLAGKIIDYIQKAFQQC